MWHHFMVTVSVLYQRRHRVFFLNASLTPLPLL